MADQLRYDVLGKGFTPNIDSIAADGTAFGRAYWPALSACLPEVRFLPELIPTETVL